MTSPLLLRGDPIPDNTENVSRTRVRKGGVLVGARQAINLIEGTNVALTVADDPVNEEIDVTLAVASAAPSGAAGGVLSGTYPDPGFAVDMATQAELDAHTGDTSAAHAASAISVSSTTLVGVGTDAQAVFEELDNAIVADETALANHLADTADAHDASAISVADSGSLLAATEVEAALAELAGRGVVLIGEVVTSSSAAIATFASIPATYRHLFILWETRSTTAGDKVLAMTFNNDTGGNYDYQLHVTANANSTNTGAEASSTTALRIGSCPGTGSTANAPGRGRVDINHYQGGVFHRGYLYQNGWLSSAGVGVEEKGWGGWRSTVAVSEIDIVPASGAFVDGSRFALYGIF